MGWLRLLLVCVFFIGIQSSRIMNVHEDVLSFIMGCDGRFRDSPNLPPAPALPIARSEIDPQTGLKMERVTMVDIPQLKTSLKESVGDDEVVTHILAHVEENLKARHDVNAGSNGCTNIKIDVPPQKVTGLSEQLQAVVQQNNYQLLEQVNTLFTFKLNSFFKEVEELLTSQTGKLAEGLLQLQQSQQKVADSLLNSPKEQCLPAAGETRIFQTAPVVSPPILDSPAVQEEMEVEEPLLISEIPPEEETILPEAVVPIEGFIPVAVDGYSEDSLPFEQPIVAEVPPLPEETVFIEEPLLPVRKKLPTDAEETLLGQEETLPIQEEPLLVDEPVLVDETLHESESTGLSENDQEVEVPTEESRKNVITPLDQPQLTEEEVIPDQVESESEPRRIAFRRRRPGFPFRRKRPETPDEPETSDKSDTPDNLERPVRPGRPERPRRPEILGRPERRKRPGGLRRRIGRPNIQQSSEKEEPSELAPTEPPPEEEVVPEKEQPVSPSNRMSLLLERRKLLLQRQHAHRG